MFNKVFAVVAAGCEEGLDLQREEKEGLVLLEREVVAVGLLGLVVAPSLRT